MTKVKIMCIELFTIQNVSKQLYTKSIKLMFLILKRDNSPKNDNSVIIYSPSRLSKPVKILYSAECIKNTRLCKSLATVKLLVTHIVQNIFFCGQKKKETNFWVNYPFNALATSSSFELGDNIVYN